MDPISPAVAERQKLDLLAEWQRKLLRHIIAAGDQVFPSYCIDDNFDLIPGRRRYQRLYDEVILAWAKDFEEGKYMAEWKHLGGGKWELHIKDVKPDNSMVDRYIIRDGYGLNGLMVQGRDPDKNEWKPPIEPIGYFW